MNDLVEEYLTFIDDDKKHIYRDIAQAAIDLGFIPKKDKVKHFGISFMSKKYGVTLLRMINDKRPELRLKFFATEDYSKAFDDSIKYIIEKFQFKYVGCYGCGKCKTKKEGYIVNYPNNKTDFRCGSELIEIMELNGSIKDEIIDLMKNQKKYYDDKLIFEERKS